MNREATDAQMHRFDLISSEVKSVSESLPIQNVDSSPEDSPLGKQCDLCHTIVASGDEMTLLV